MRKKLLTNYRMVFNIILLFLASIVIYNWFSPKLIISTGETGLPFYDLSRTFNVARYTWMDYQLGLANPFYIHFLPVWWILLSFSKYGIASWFLQASLFYLLLALPLLSFPLLLEQIFGKRYYIYGIISGLFYTFNLFVLSQVWARFLYSLIFLWSLLPLLLLLWIMWIKDGKKYSLFILLVLFVIFAGIFALPTGIIAIWITFGLYSLISLNKNKIVVFRTLVGLILWGFVSFWWLIPTLQLRNNNYASSLNYNNNIISLNEVSKYYSNIDIFRLEQKFYFGSNGQFKDISQSIYKRNISYAIFIIVLIGLLLSLKNKKLRFASLLFIIGWFISKGSNPPFGNEFYTFLYRLNPYFQVLRNPYEKIGTVYLLGYSILFSFGLFFIVTKLKFLKQIVLIYIIFIVIFYLPSPILSSRVYSKGERFKVPEYYADVNDYFKKDGRILHLPFQETGGISFLWGFSGEEPSIYLFDKPSISAPTSIKELDNFYYIIGENINSNNFTKYLSLTNTRYILLHEDKNLQGFIGYGVEASREFLENQNDIVFKKKFDKLYVYEYINDLSGWVYGVRNYIKATSWADVVIKINSDNFNSASTVIITDEFVEKYDLSSVKVTNSMLKVDYTKNNQTEYKVAIENANGNFILVLNDNFNPLWHAYLNGNLLDKHLLVNGYANGWVVEEKGNFEINIRFNTFPKSWHL